MNASFHLKYIAHWISLWHRSEC